MNCEYFFRQRLGERAVLVDRTALPRYRAMSHTWENVAGETGSKEAGGLVPDAVGSHWI